MSADTLLDEFRTLQEAEDVAESMYGAAMREEGAHARAAAVVDRDQARDALEEFISDNGDELAELLAADPLVITLMDDGEFARDNADGFRDVPTRTLSMPMNIKPCAVIEEDGSILSLMEGIKASAEAIMRKPVMSDTITDEGDFLDMLGKMEPFASVNDDEAVNALRFLMDTPWARQDVLADKARLLGRHLAEYMQFYEARNTQFSQEI